MSGMHFECCVCNISLPVIYKGTNPPFLPGIEFKEDVYIMKAVSEETMPIPIGGVCTVCGKSCCLQPACSSVASDNKRYCKHHLP